MSVNGAPNQYARNYDSPRDQLWSKTARQAMVEKQCVLISELKVLNRFIRPVFLKLWVATKKWVTGLSLVGPRVAKLDSSKVLFF